MPLQTLFSDLVEKVSPYLKDFDEKRLHKAFDFANRAHSGQKRKSGEEYIIHPLETAYILSELHADEASLIAALLHDVPEDTEISLKEIEKNFTKEVAFLVNGITKLSKVYYRHDMAGRQVESLKRLLLYSAQDVRVIMIKLADRLHNMRTLTAIENPNKRLRIARETLEIYVPIANLIGISLIRDEMADLCFQYLFKSKYDLLNTQIGEYKNKYQELFDQTVAELRSLLENREIRFRILGGFKPIYQVFQELEASGKNSLDIEDLISVILVLENREECYRTLGLLHEFAKPKLGQIKDYIAVPKPNGYQSLHTMVFGLKGLPMEFVIRTDEMHIQAQYGFAAQFFSGCKLMRVQRQHFSQSNWARQIAHLREEMKDNEHFMERLRFDIFQDRIFAFTPRGDVVDLPRGATGLDFAYAIHTELGHSAESAVINNRKMSLGTVLKTGDTININSNNEQKFPKREWLNMVRTQLARNKIRQSLKRESIEKKRLTGKMFLEQELKKTSKHFYEIFHSKNIALLLKEFSFKGFDELLEAVGEGSLDPKMILEKIYSQKKHFYEEILGRPIKKDAKGPYKVEIKVSGIDRVGYLQSLLTPIAEMGVSVLKTRTDADLKRGKAISYFTLMIKDYDELSRIYESLRNAEGVESMERLVPNKFFFLTFLSIIALLSWSVLPYAIHHTFMQEGKFTFSFLLASILGFLVIFASLCYVFEYLKIHYGYWSSKTFEYFVVPGLSMLASIIIVAEMKYLDIPFLVASVYGFLNMLLSVGILYFFSSKIGFRER